MSRSLRLAIVVMRYGEEVSGGAEQHARWLAEHLTAHAEVHALTTCAVDENWADHYPTGIETLNKVQVHRFPVDRAREFDVLDKRSRVFHYGGHTIDGEHEWLMEQGPISTAMSSYIEEKRRFYDAFLFFTFEHATTFYGMPPVAAKSILLPLAHDHHFIRSRTFRHMLQLPAAIAYNTRASRQLVQSFTANRHIPNEVVGVGINVPDDIDPQRFRDKFGIDGEFVLYIGRIHAGKNVPELLDFYQRYYENVRKIPLVLIGREMLPIPDLPNIIRPGHVSEQDKFDALAAASVFILPSQYESLSMVTLEAWSTGTPVLINARCDIVKDQVSLSNGGLYYRNYAEFEMCLEVLLNEPELSRQLGAQGKQFTDANYDWDIVVHKILKLVQIIVER